jgi:hypothetical protein
VEEILFKLRPYINEFNVLASNPQETDLDKVKPLTLRQIANIIGVKTRDVIDVLTSVTIGDEYVFAVCEVGKKHTVIVNGKFTGNKETMRYF